MLGVYSQANPPISSPWLDEVVQDLIQAEELIRIKKLLIYTCTHTWESNPEKIDAADLQDLLQMLLVIAPTLEKLQLILHSVASSLNKPAEYTLIAAAIIHPIRQRYPVSAQIPQFVSEAISYETIARSLQQDPEAFRICKLLLFACKNLWIIDRHQLAQFDLATLVQELHNIAPSLESLRLILGKSVKKLNKSTAYRLISERVIQTLQPLYQMDASLSEIANSDALNSDLESTKLVVEPPEQSSHQIEPSPVKTGSENQVRRVALPVTRSPQDPEELFDLRLELIRYANPFRSKILLFSLLHEQFNQTTEHYLMLKNYSLDLLLRTLLQTYRSFEELAANLFKLAKQLDEPEDYTRVAQTVLRVVRVAYGMETITPDKTVPDKPEHEQSTDSAQPTNSSGELTGPESFSSADKLA